MSTTGTTKEKVLNSISGVSNIDTNELKLEDNLSDLGLDSLDVIDIIMDIEREFNIAIPDADVEKMNTVDDMIKYVESKVDKH